MAVFRSPFQIALREADEVEGAGPTIGGQTRRPDPGSRRTPRLPPQPHELAESVLTVHEAEPEPRIVARFGLDVRHAVAVPHDLHGATEARDREFARLHRVGRMHAATLLEQMCGDAQQARHQDGDEGQPTALAARPPGPLHLAFAALLHPESLPEKESIGTDPSTPEPFLVRQPRSAGMLLPPGGPGRGGATPPSAREYPKRRSQALTRIGDPDR